MVNKDREIKMTEFMAFFSIDFFGLQLRLKIETIIIQICYSTPFLNKVSIESGSAFAPT